MFGDEVKLPPGRAEPIWQVGPEMPTLRDRFAMAALPIIGEGRHGLLDPRTGDRLNWLAGMSYRLADAMLEARKREGGDG